MTRQVDVHGTHHDRPPAGQVSRPRAAVAGVLAVGAGLAVGDLLAALVAPRAAPISVVGALLVDHAPAFAREWAIDTFGVHDKIALLIGVGAAVVVLSAVAGLVYPRAPVVAVGLVVAFTAVGVTAGVLRPAGTWLYVLPPLISGVVCAVVLLLFGRSAIRSARGAAGHDTGDDTCGGHPRIAAGWSRRRFLGVAVVLAGAIAATEYAVRAISAAGGAMAERMRLRLPGAADPAPPIGDGVDIGVPGTTPFLTSAADFYRIDTALAVPSLTTDEWSLRIHGMVDEEVTLTWEDLTALPAMERIVTLTCVSNEVGGDLAGNGRWLGYAMRPLLERAGIHPDADMLLSTSVDGWTGGTPLSAVRDGRDAMLAIGLNGEPLPLEHGYPVRQVIPGLYGYVSACKWVVDWEITRFDQAQAYWTRRGWGVRAPIKTASRIDRPAPLAVLPPGPVVVAGTAWAQHRGVRRVEVRVDGGPWQTATLAREYSTDTWRQWSWEWDAAPGLHTVECRATDATGATQPEDRVPPIPDGATGWHSRVFRVQD
jgi:DMSO/TMAO reductase YedYZ molybdopterin-dependent catalytic subunit